MNKVSANVNNVINQLLWSNMYASIALPRKPHRSL
jgi:hypothetical protein